MLAWQSLFTRLNGLGWTMVGRTILNSGPRCGLPRTGSQQWLDPTRPRRKCLEGRTLSVVTSELGNTPIKQYWNLSYLSSDWPASSSLFLGLPGESNVRLAAAFCFLFFRQPSVFPKASSQEPDHKVAEVEAASCSVCVLSHKIWCLNLSIMFFKCYL